jgi:hypothetical protein
MEITGSASGEVAWFVSRKGHNARKEFDSFYFLSEPPALDKPQKNEVRITLNTFRQDYD